MTATASVRTSRDDMSVTPSISGTTAIIPLIGHPVAQVKSPPVLNAWFAREGIDAVVIPMDLPPASVAAFFELVRSWANCAGVSVTVPHKQAAFAHVDTATDRARLSGAVNAVRRDANGKLHGDNTDGLACVAALEKKGISLRGRNCLLVGAGGAGSAIAHALADAGASSLLIHDIDARRCDALIAAVRARHPDLPIHSGVEPLSRVDFAVNGSTLGMKPGDPLPFDPAKLAKGAVVADVVTRVDIRRSWNFRARAGSPSRQARKWPPPSWAYRPGGSTWSGIAAQPLRFDPARGSARLRRERSHRDARGHRTDSPCVERREAGSTPYLFGRPLRRSSICAASANPVVIDVFGLSGEGLPAI